MKVDEKDINRDLFQQLFPLLLHLISLQQAKYSIHTNSLQDIWALSLSTYGHLNQILYCLLASTTATYNALQIHGPLYVSWSMLEKGHTIFDTCRPW